MKKGLQGLSEDLRNTLDLSSIWKRDFFLANKNGHLNLIKDFQLLVGWLLGWLGTFLLNPVSLPGIN